MVPVSTDMLQFVGRRARQKTHTYDEVTTGFWVNRLEPDFFMKRVYAPCGWRQQKNPHHNVHSDQLMFVNEGWDNKVAIIIFKFLLIGGGQ